MALAPLSESLGKPFPVKRISTSLSERLSMALDVESFGAEMGLSLAPLTVPSIFWLGKSRRARVVTDFRAFESWVISGRVREVVVGDFRWPFGLARAN